MSDMDGRTLLDVMDGARAVLWAVSGEFEGRDAGDFAEAFSLLTEVSDRLYEREYGDDRREEE